jgi:glutaredoxin 3
MAAVTLYTTRFCPFCVRAKHLLDRKGAAYREISVDGNAELRREMMQRSGRHTVPQIWIGSRHVGGCDDLYELERRGALDAALRAAADDAGES